MKTLLIGGPGNISSGTIHSFQKKNSECAIFTLPETDTQNLDKHISLYKGNRDNSEILSKVINDYKPDVVIDFVCFTPDQCENTCKILQGKVKQYILISTVDVYGYPLTRLPMPENGKFVARITDYARNKYECECIVNRFHDLPFTIARPSYSMGYSFVLSSLSHMGGMQLIYRLRKGLPIFSPGDGTTLLHASIALNTGMMIAELAGSDIAIGKTYNCAHEYFISHDMYIQLFADAVQAKTEIVHIPTDFVLKNFPHDYEHTMLGILTRYNLAFDIQSFKDDFPHFVWEVSLKDFVNDYIAYCDQNNLLNGQGKTIIDDKIIALWRQKGM